MTIVKIYEKYVSFKIFIFYFVRILSSRILFKLNFSLHYPSIREPALLNLLKKFKVYQTEHQLVRLGEKGGGGYLIPDDFEPRMNEDGNIISLNSCITGGVGSEIGFEYDLAQKGIKCHMADYSVSKPPLTHENFFFVKKFLGNKTDNQYITFDDYFSKIKKPLEDYILKLDIEGDEYTILPFIKKEDLLRMRIIVLEIHHFTNIATPLGFYLMQQIADKLFENHTVVHIYPNSISPLIKFSKKIQLYDLLEVTLLRNDRINVKKEQRNFPHSLDSKTNNFFKAKLPKCFYEC